ncbi:MAG: cation:proton antiporter [Candidatus Baltobacteraceae bacterium]
MATSRTPTNEVPLWAILCILAVGGILGLFEPGRLSYAFGAATLFVFLPPLLFEAAWNLDARLMLTRWRPIFALAVPGVAITTAIVAAAVWFGGFPLPAALILGAIVSATDPIAVVAIFRRLPVPVALSTIVQSEALLNDATAVVLYRSLVLAAAGALSVGSVVGLAALAVASAAGGILIGVSLAVAIAHVLVRRNLAVIQIWATLAGVYVAYFTAEALHASGIFAVIAFGIALREAERRAISVQAAEDVGRFWDGCALFANICVFFLTGAAIQITRLAHEPYAAAAALAGVLAARLVLAYILSPVALGSGANRSWLHVIGAAGARGALSLALALALPVTLAFRAQIIDVTFVIVLATLFSSAFIVPRAIRRRMA